MKVIKRDNYLYQLIASMNNGLIKIVTGLRRSGKTFILFKLFKEYLLEWGIKEENIISLALDDDDYLEYRDPRKLSAYIKSRIKNDEPYYILIDEAQLAISKEEQKGEEAPLLYSLLNSLLRKENVDVYITGSNSKFLSSDILTEFRGRGDEIRIYPLSFSEFSEGFEGSKEDAFREYITYGGLPFLINETSHERKAKYLKNLFANTYMKDILERHNLRGDMVMDNLIDVLASNIGSLTNPNKLAKTFVSSGIKTDDKTVSSYIDYLLDAFLIEKSRRFDIKGKEYIGSPYKYYFADLGLRNARLNFRQGEPNHLMENLVYNELLIRGYDVDVGVVNKYNGKVTALEVDFVASKGGKRYYVQSAYSLPDEKKMKQETASLDGINDSFKKIIVTQDNILPWYTEKGYLIINILDFLLDPNSLDI